MLSTYNLCVCMFSGLTGTKQAVGVLFPGEDRGSCSQLSFLWFLV